MAFIGDMKNIILQLKLTNYAEALDSKPRHHVRRISFCVTILEDVGGTDEILDYPRPWSEEDEEVLKWQPRTENWQNDFEVRDTLTNLSGRLCQGLCPYNTIGFSLFGKVTDNDTHQERIEPPSLSPSRHASFCSVMLTQHSVSSEQVQLLFSRDGLPEDRSCLRWRSHDYIKLVLSDAKPSYRAFWLVQWDVVDMTDYINDGLVATGPVTRLGINHSRPCLDPSTSERQSDDPQKFSGIRFREKRKSPWSAEVKPRGSRNKISVGCYQSRAAAARAVDAGRYYYDLNLDKINFADSLRFLDKIEVPPNLHEEAFKAFVFKQAHRLAKLAEKPPSSTAISETRSCNTNTGGFTSRNISSANNFGAHNMRTVTNVSFAGFPIARPDGFAAPSMDSGRDQQANLVDVRPSTSFGSGVLREPAARSSPEDNLLVITSNNRFTTNSLVRAGDFHPELEPSCPHEASFAPVRNTSSNDFFNVHDTAWDENPEQDIPDDSARRISDIPFVGVSDANHLIHGIQSQSADFTFPGYDFNSPGAGSEQAESNGDYGRDLDLLDWTYSEEGYAQLDETVDFIGEGKSTHSSSSACHWEFEVLERVLQVSQDESDRKLVPSWYRFSSLPMATSLCNIVESTHLSADKTLISHKTITTLPVT